jgi:ribosomal protein L22
MSDEETPETPETPEPEETPKPRRRRSRKKPAEAVPEVTSASETTSNVSESDATSEPDEDAVEETPDDVAAEEATEVVLEADDEAEEADEPELEAEGEEPEAEEEPGAEAEAPKPRRRRRRSAEPEEEAPAKPAPTRRRRERDPDLPPPVVRAQAKYVRSSARKARLVCDNIRGRSVEDARAILAHTPRAVARDWSKLLESAVANAEHNHELVGEDLYVKAVHADEGPTIRRFRPRAMGRATKIRKRTSHLTILLTPKE